MITPGPPRLIQVCDAVVCSIRDLWRPEAPDAVERVYLPDVERPEDLQGRRIWVFPMGMSQVDTADREEDSLLFNVGVLLTERCEQADWPPDKDWGDKRLGFVDALFRHLGEARDMELFPRPLQHLYPDTADIPVAFDPDTLRESRLFWSLLEFGFRGDE